MPKYVTIGQYLSICEINDILKWNVVNRIPQPQKRKITLQDLKNLKKTKNYLNQLYESMIKDL